MQLPSKYCPSAVKYFCKHFTGHNVSGSHFPLEPSLYSQSDRPLAVPSSVESREALWYYAY
jgi:hypothetical protein